MTMRARWAVLGAAAAALGVAAACGDVPTLVQGIAYITPIITPSPTVAYGDTLRDSLGHAAPLRVVALGRTPGDTIRGFALRYLFTSLGTGATVDENGYLVAPDSLLTLRLVAQATDPTGGSGLQLQTPEISIDVVPRADTIYNANTPDTATALPFVKPVAVTVAGMGPSVRGTVAGIVVTYRIQAVYPALPTAGRYYLADAQSNVLHPDSTIAIDTTKSGGLSQRSFIGVLAPNGGANADSVVVSASARSQKGVPLSGSPVLITIRIKKS